MVSPIISLKIDVDGPQQQNYYLLRLLLRANGANLDFYPFESTAKPIPEFRSRYFAKLLADESSKIVALGL